MSLTNFLKRSDVKLAFKKEFGERKPRNRIKRDMVAPPLTKLNPEIGIAFDYLLRFYLKRRFPLAIERPWFMETIIESPNPMFAMRLGISDYTIVQDSYGKSYIEDNKTHSAIPVGSTPVGRAIIQILQSARTSYANYLNDGVVTDELLYNLVKLAKLEPLGRAPHLGWDNSDVDSRAMDDLLNLIDAIDETTFQVEKLCLLNPTFGKASEKLYGADADIIIDNMLIDIKTTKDFTLPGKYYYQLVGYYCLSILGEVDNAPEDMKIDTLGIYYSRYGYLFTFPVSDIVNPNTFDSFLEWFKKRIKWDEDL